MGERVIVNPVTLPENSSFSPEINTALQKLANEFDKVLYKDGTEELSGHLNANSKRITNLPPPVTDSEPLRKGDIGNLVGIQKGDKGDKGDPGGPGFAEDVVFTDTVAPNYLKTVSDILNGMPIDFFRFANPVDHAGIRAGTNTTDLSNVFDAVMDSGVKEINLQPGVYNIDDTLVINRPFRFRGAGATLSTINIRSTTKTAIQVANGVDSPVLNGFGVTRTGVSTNSAHGIHFLGTSDRGLIEDVLIDGHYNNLILNTCDTGHINRLTTRRAYGHGLFQTCVNFYGPSQWDMNDILSEKNTLDGYHIESTVGTPGMILGQMRNLRSFANSGAGMRVLGSSDTPIYDVRMSDCFLGSDGGGALILDTHGGKHRINGFFERSGRDATGRNVATAASGNVANIVISGNNHDVIMYGSTIDEASLDGIVHDGGVLLLMGNMIYNNGQAGTAGRRNGVLTSAGEVVMVGNKSGNIGGASQVYGIAANHSNIVVNGNSLKDNSLNPFYLGAVPGAVVLGNAQGSQTAYLPNTINELTFNSGYTPGATGGNKGAGTLNLAGGLFKNDSPYLNP